MKDQLVSLLMERVGLEPAKAEQAVNTIMEYLQNNPEQLSTLMNKFGVGGLSDKLGGMTSK